MLYIKISYFLRENGRNFKKTLYFFRFLHDKMLQNGEDCAKINISIISIDAPLAI